MKTIQIAPDLKLPLDSVLLKKAILAKTGAGKSNTAAVYVEPTLDAAVQVIIIDPKGDWWGLKSSADGKSEGYPVLILGGDHGDVPLEPAAGELVAKSLVESGASAILDVSDFSKKSLYQFVGDFATAFYTAKKKRPTPVLLVFEEADEIAPQKLPPAVYGPAPAICLSAIEKIIKRGRFIGIGTLVITQRSASLNKDVLTQTDLLIIMQTTAPQDVDAVDAWIEHHPDQEKRKEVLATIQSLPIGHGYVWCPALNLFVKTHFNRRSTFDSGQTPKIGETRKEPKVLAKADIETLKGQMAALVEKAKADDPSLLKAEIRKLQKELANRSPTVEERVVEKVIEGPPMPTVPVGFVRSLEGARDNLNALIESIPKKDVWPHGYVRDPRAPALDEMTIEAPANQKRPNPPASRPRPEATKPVYFSHEAEKRAKITLTAATVAEREELNGPMQRILDAVAWFHAIGIDEPKKEAVAFKAGYRPGGGAFNNPLGALRNEKGNNPWPPLIEYGSGTVRLTKDGAKRAARPSDAGTAEDLQREVLHALDGPMAKILRVLLEAYPNSVSKEQLANDSGYAEGGGAFNNPLGRLRSCGLIDYPQKGTVVALPLLFLEA